MGYKTEFTTHIACTTERKMQHDKSQTYFDKGALENIQPKTKVVYPEKINRLAIPIDVKGKVPSKNKKTSTATKRRFYDRWQNTVLCTGVALLTTLLNDNGMHKTFCVF